MPPYIKTAFYSLFLLPIIGCHSYPETPEEVVMTYTNHLNNSDCAAAMEFCTGNAESTIEGLISNGCTTFKSRIDSVKCTFEKEVATCFCYQQIESMDFCFPYALIQINGEWKIAEDSKDIGMEEPLFD